MNQIVIPGSFASGTRLTKGRRLRPACLSHFSRRDQQSCSVLKIAKTILPQASQKALADMIRIALSRVSFVMNKLRELDFVH